MVGSGVCGVGREGTAYIWWVVMYVGWAGRGPPTYGG